MNRKVILCCRSINILRNLSTNAKSDIANASYCANNVQKYDNENFLCSLLIKKGRREALAIKAFNVEIARVPTVVSDQKISLMRLKFWEDSIVQLFDKNLQSQNLPEHPVIRELELVLNATKLTKRYFDRLINARKIQNLNFISTKQMENYAEESVSSVHYLLLESFNCRNVNADHAASHLGKAQGITNMLRSIYNRGRSQYLPIPQEILMQHGVSQERFFRSKPNDKGVEDVVFDIATLAHQHLEKSLALMSQVPKESKVLFLPAVTTRRYLERLRKVNFNLRDKSLGIRDNLLPLALYWNNFKGLK
ncbi:CLUMA_CG009989, isoform A [Clunio marinus]|uniref:CLUMA_CG009989, isoform A n=1 Tax=Clunio marinus TaxID=568069 RepID=A0A1J1I9A6_9DIPT|nr:CLUMA_CG009989, isoform A [Clunio marinus]